MYSKDNDGVFKHYKNGLLYRLLFVSQWCSDSRRSVEENEVVRVCARYGGGGDVSSTVVFPQSLGSHEDRLILQARWSGGANEILVGDRVAIYIALYDDGKTWARPLSEFMEEVSDKEKTVPRFQALGRLL